MAVIVVLDVINAMLGSIGMTALTSSDTGHPRYIQALAKLTEIHREFQSEGWWFNQQIVTLTSTASEVAFGSDVLHCDPTDTTKLYVMRELKLYDLTLATFTITEDVECNIIYELPFAELPPLAKIYMKAKARFDFYVDQDGSEPKLTKYEEAAARAWVRFKQEHLKNKDLNFFFGGHGVWFRQAYHPGNVNRVIARQ